MDRLLRLFLSKFIRRGSMTFVTASGARFTCGDGTGEPVQAHFLARATERQILANPELALGEATMVVALSGAAFQAVELARARAEQRRPSLRSRRTPLFVVPRCRQTI